MDSENKRRKSDSPTPGAKSPKRAKYDDIDPSLFPPIPPELEDIVQINQDAALFFQLYYTFKNLERQQNFTPLTALSNFYVKRRKGSQDVIKWSVHRTELERKKRKVYIDGIFEIVKRCLIRNDERMLGALNSEFNVLELFKDYSVNVCELITIAIQLLSTKLVTFLFHNGIQLHNYIPTCFNSSLSIPRHPTPEEIQELKNIFALFEKQGAQLSGINSQKRRKLFIEACVINHIPLVLFLVDELGTPRTSRPTLQTSLARACGNGHLEVLKILHERNVDLLCDHGVPLLAAARNRHEDVVDYLLRARAFNMKTMEFALKRDEPNLVQALVSVGCECQPWRISNLSPQMEVALREGTITRSSVLRDVLKQYCAADVAQIIVYYENFI